MNATRVAAMAQKEWREIVRDRLFFALAFVVPVVLMLLLGFGLTLDVEHLPMAIVDHDRSAMSRDYAYRFRSSRYFTVLAEPRDDHELSALLMGNGVRAAVVIPAHFERDILAGQSVHVQTLIDGSLPYRAQVVKGYITMIDAAASADLAASWLSRAGATAAGSPVRLEARYLYNQGALSAWSFGPKLLMMILFMCSPFLTALGVVREKESGAVYNIFSSTVSRGEFLLGKLAPYAAIALVNGAVLWLMATQLLGAPFKGSLVFLTAATVLYVLASTGIGLLVSLLVRTQVASMFVTAVVTMIPAQLYSGALIPLASMNAAGRGVARSLPALHYHEIVVGVFLKGVGLAELWPRVLLLAGYSVALWIAALALFTKRPRA